jgi:hypothetical protein
MFRSIIQNQKGLVLELVLVTVVSKKDQQVYALVSIKVKDSTKPYSSTKKRYYCFLDALT